jgi:hypothetical protein
MGIRIEPFAEAYSPAVREFNNRVRGRSGAFEFPETASPEWLPPAPGRSIFQEQFLAIDRGEICGGYVLKHQKFAFRGAIRSIACYHSALSEGIAEPRYEDIADMLLDDALRRQPYLYAIEPQRTPLPEWKWTGLSRKYRIVHSARFLQNMQSLRSTPGRRFALSLAALTGVGWAGVSLYQRLHGKAKPIPPVTVDFFDNFGAWTDELWARCAPQYPFAAVRDSETLAVLYPGGKFLRMKVASAGKLIGWVVALDTQMQWNAQFGDIRLGTILDCLALPEHAPQVIAAARRVLERRGVDLIICDHSHPVWTSALSDAGLLSGEPNLYFGCSPALTIELQRTEAWESAFLMRCDGNMRALAEFAHTLL